MHRLLSEQPAIAAYAELKPARYPDCTAVELMARTFFQILQDWKLNKQDIDGLLVCPAGMAAGSGADIFIHERLFDMLGIQPRFAETVNAGGATYAIMLQWAAMAIETGACQAVLCIGAGKFPSVSGGAAEAMAKMTSHEEFEFIYGTFIPAMYALGAMRHMHDYGTTPEQLARVAVTMRKWAQQNPKAITFGKGELSVEDVLASRVVATPFHLYDCSIPCEGGAAFIVSSGRKAREYAPQPAYLLGVGEYHSHGFIFEKRKDGFLVPQFRPVQSKP